MVRVGDALEGRVIFDDPYSCSVRNLPVVEVTDKPTSGCNDSIHTPEHLECSRKSFHHRYF